VALVVQAEIHFAEASWGSTEAGSDDFGVHLNVMTAAIFTITGSMMCHESLTNDHQRRPLK